MYPGSISDKDITVKSGILNAQFWNAGDSFMADRGFTVQESLGEIGIELIISSFLRGRNQLTESEAICRQQIANERIHLERMIQCLKTWHIFDRVIPVNILGSLTQIVTVRALLSNFQEPIIASKDSDN